MGDGITIGSHSPYHWLTTTDQYIGTLVRLCPEVFVGRVIAVSSIDSGIPWLTEEQSAAGWERRSGIVYSPRLTSTKELFYQRDGLNYPGYDEWYVFDTGAPDLGELIRRGIENPFETAFAPRPQRLLAFVNFGPAFAIDAAGSSDQTLAEMFWKQLEWVNPESYIGDGTDCLTLVSRNIGLFDIGYERLNDAL